MLVICYGMAKSGSTLAFEMVRGILMSVGQNQGRVSCDGVSANARGNYMQIADRAAIESLVDYTGDRRILAVKSHHVFRDELFPWLEGLQAARKVQVIASYRDPRDVCLSLVDAGRKAREKGQPGFANITGLPDAVRQVRTATQNFRKWGALRGTLRLNYEIVAFAPDEAIDAIEQALGVKSDRQKVMSHAFESAFTQKNRAVRHRYLVELKSDEQAALSDTFGQFIARVCEGNDDHWFANYRTRLLNQIGSDFGKVDKISAARDAQ